MTDTPPGAGTPFESALGHGHEIITAGQLDALSVKIDALAGRAELIIECLEVHADALEQMVEFCNRTDQTLARVRAVVSESIPKAIRVAQSLRVHDDG